MLLYDPMLICYDDSEIQVYFNLSLHENIYIGLVVCCLTSFSTIFQLYRGGIFFLVEEIGVPGENHQPAPIKIYKMYFDLLSD